MSWNCSCKQSNDDNVLSCSNCGRKKPKYLAVKIDFEKNDLSSEELSIWYLSIANNYLKSASETNSQVTEFINSNGNSPYKDSSINFRFLKLKNIIISDCNNCLKFIEESIKINPKAQFKDVNEAVQDSSSLKSLCYYELGYIEYKSTDFAKALDYFQNSFNSDPNQISIFQIALATIKLPAEGGGFFGGKKTEEAKANKKIQEIDLLKKTIQFSPFSFLGIKSASLLYENYGILVNQADLKNK